MSAHAKTECDQSDNIAEMKAKICHIDKTLFFGNGKPPITTQLELMAQRFDTMEKKIDSAMSIGKAIVVLFLGLVVADVYQMFKDHTQKKEEQYHASGK
jgi:hypothetical protein